MEELLSSWWGVQVTLAGGIGVVVGFVKSIESVRVWIGEKARRRVQQENMEDRIMAAIDEQDKAVRKKDKEQSELIDRVITRLDKIEGSISDVQEMNTAISYDKLMYSYVKYCIKQEPISVSILTSLQRIYEAYVKNGRNHIPTDFMERLEKCPVER